MSTPRTREMFVASALEPYYSKEGDVPTFACNTDASSSPQHSHGKWMQDYDTAGFHRLSRNGQIILNPMVSYTCDLHDTRAVIGYHRSAWSNSSRIGEPLSTLDGVMGINHSALSYGILPPRTAGPRLRPPVTSGAALSSRFDAILEDAGLDNWVDGFEENALVRAVSNETAADAAVLSTVGEFGETVRLLPDTLRLFAGFSRQLQTRVISLIGRSRAKVWARGALLHTTPKEAKLLSNAWLQYRYGIRPLIYDIRNIARAVERRLSPRLTCRGYASGNKSLNRYSWAELDDHEIRGTTHTAISTVSRAGTLCSVDTDLANISAVRLGADRILTTAWDLVPYSFMVDWFLDISSLVGTWQPSIGLKRLGDWVTTETSITQTFKVDKSSPCFSSWDSSFYYYYYYTTTINLIGSGYVVSRITRRRRLVNVASAATHVRYEPRVGVANLTDLIALVVGILR